MNEYGDSDDYLQYKQSNGGGYSPDNHGDDSQYLKNAPDLDGGYGNKGPAGLDQDFVLSYMMNNWRNPRASDKSNDDNDDLSSKSEAEDEDSPIQVALRNMPDAKKGLPRQVSEQSESDEELKEDNFVGGGQARVKAKQDEFAFNSLGAAAGPRKTEIDAVGKEYNEGEMFDKINELDADRGRDDEEEPGTGAGLDPKYVKEAKRGALSRFFSPTLQTRKEERGFGDKVKGFFSGLGEFGVWALTGLQTGAIGMGYRAKKNYHRWRTRTNQQKANVAMGRKDEAAAKRARLKVQAHGHKADLARSEQLRIGEHSSGYHWRKRLGRKFLTNAEKAAHVRLAGSEDWRSARDELQLTDAQKQPGGRFAREKLARTKQALAAQKAVARAEARGAAPDQLAQLQSQSQAAVKQAEVAHQQDPTIKRATARMNSRQSNIRGGESLFERANAQIDKKPQMGVIEEDEEEEKSEDESPQQQKVPVNNRNSVVDENGNLILEDEDNESEGY